VVKQVESDAEESDDEGEAVDLFAVAKFSYVATEEDEVSFIKGQRIHLVWRDSWDEATQVRIKCILVCVVESWSKCSWSYFRKGGILESWTEAFAATCPQHT
jgi:hypothetical protein